MPVRNPLARPAAPVAHLVASISACALLALGACGGSDDDDELPQLGAATGATLSGTCEVLAAKLSVLADTTISATSTVAAGTLTVGAKPVAEHCLVSGKMFERISSVDGQTYAIGFELRLPKDWSGRFFYQANGGLDGTIVEATGSSGGGPLTHALHQGFAVISSDAGHSAAQIPLFGIDPQARLDFGYQAVAKLTPMAKQAIAVAYGKAPDRSYFGGCSNGGRHTFVAAARYADQYDGFLAGAPGFNMPKAVLANIYGAQRYATVATDPADISTAFTSDERATLSSAVLAKCDALDGATDGLVQDTNACRAAFNIEADVPTCSGSRNGSCLSAAQKVAIAPIFGGATTSDGTPVYASFPYDSGHGAAGVAFWEFTAPLALDSGAMAFVFQVPPASPSGFDGPAFTLSADIDALYNAIDATNATYTESALQFLTPPEPSNLSALKNRGAKMMVYHGVSDAIWSVDDTEAWYKSLNGANGGDASNFARFYRVPGMGHCSGGPATNQFDMLSKLVDWVEQGDAPQEVIATARGAGNAGGVNEELPSDWSPARTRPLCPYPKVASYSGSGDVEVAQSFACE